MARLLVVDDERSLREVLDVYFTDLGHEVDTAADVERGVLLFREKRAEVVITDLRLGKGSGIDLLRQVKAVDGSAEVIVMTAYATADAGIQAAALGAYDFVTKTAHLTGELKLRVNGAIEKLRLARENQLLRHRLEGRPDGLLGRSPAMRSLDQMIDRVAPARTTVLVTGESGTGKELVARAVHHRSPRSAAPFVPVNCGAIPEGLIESELFGHVKGAFTGAQGTRQGLFQSASGGSLFLDEVGELPLALQVKLLRAIQERRVRAVGADEDEEVDVRLIAATNRDLAAEVASGGFREDLYYRLNVIQLRVPPLRDRREDVMMLAEHFLRRFEAEHGRGRLDLSREAKRRLDAYDFPGNVRELENLIERAVTLSDGPEVTLDALPGPLRPALPTLVSEGPLLPGFSLEAHLSGIEQQLIDRALTQAGGVKKNAAALLGLTFRQFRHRLKKLNGDTDKGDADDEQLG
ncbi:MAG TPA: sigma-54 dependent transcriptional regulator [Myxococcales bacterium]|jgi:two-component system response regulator PilR (NtrC family)